MGALSNYAIERFYLHYLNDSGKNVQAEIFTAQNIFLNWYKSSFVNKIIFRLGIQSVYGMINDRLKEKVVQFQPDILFIFKGMEIFPSTLEWSAKRGIKLINYNPDNPFIFSGRGSGNKNITKSIGLFDYHFTYDSSIQRKIKSDYNLPVEKLPFGFDFPEDLYNEFGDLDEINKLCFLGNPDKHRAAFIQFLAEKGVKVDVFGHKWSKFVNNGNVTAFGPVYGDDFWKTLHKYRVQLNLMRPHNPGSHNMRSFEIPAAGGIMLAPYTEDHAAFFQKNTEVFLFEDKLDCLKKINYILSLPRESADKIRKAARERSIGSGYSYCARTKQILRFFEEIVNDK